MPLRESINNLILRPLELITELWYQDLADVLLKITEASAVTYDGTVTRTLVPYPGVDLGTTEHHFRKVFADDGFFGSIRILSADVDEVSADYVSSDRSYSGYAQFRLISADEAYVRELESEILRTVNAYTDYAYVTFGTFNRIESESIDVDLINAESVYGDYVSSRIVSAVDVYSDLLRSREQRSSIGRFDLIYCGYVDANNVDAFEVRSEYVSAHYVDSYQSYSVYSYAYSISTNEIILSGIWRLYGDPEYIYAENVITKKLYRLMLVEVY